MLQGFWGGVIISLVNQTVVFLVLGGLAVAIVLVRNLVQRAEARTAKPPPASAVSAASPSVSSPSPARPQARIAAIMGAVHAFTGAAPGTLRLEGVTRIGQGGSSPWATAGRLEAMQGLGRDDRAS
jgi:Na+-transporting methylmalonyl-CoA/oxaloacetate decarboxylase gamma subunit